MAKGNFGLDKGNFGLGKGQFWVDKRLHMNNAHAKGQQQEEKNSIPFNKVKIAKNKTGCTLHD